MKPNLADANAHAERNRANRAIVTVTSLLGLTTGFGVVAWGAWSLPVTIGLTVYERAGVGLEIIAMEDALNQGMLQSAMLIALGTIILELRRIAALLGDADDD